MGKVEQGPVFDGTEAKPGSRNPNGPLRLENDVRATLRLPRRSTYAEYLAVEQGSMHRHEFFDGVIVAMAGGSDEHNALSGRLAMLVGLRLTAPCRFYTSDQRFWISAHVRSRYADGAVICGKPEHPAHDEQATTNPRVVFEVLSPSTEGDDRGDKRADFQSLDTLTAYVLVSQDARRIEVWRRDPDGRWPGTPTTFHDGDSFLLPHASEALAVADVYDGVLDEAGRSLLD